MTFPLFRHLLNVFLCLFLASCGILPWKIASEKSPRFSPELVLITRWKREIPARAGALLAPAASETTVFAAGGKEVFAFDVKKGKRLWKKRLKEEISAGMGLFGNLVLAGGAEGGVFALNSLDGSPAWEARLTSSVLSAPQGMGRIVVARSEDGRIHGLNADNGQNLWIYERQSMPLVLRTDPGFLLTPGAAFVGMPGGALAALKLETGEVVWERLIALPRGTSDLARMADVSSPPILLANAVYAAAYRGRVAQLRAADGAIGWTRDISSIAGAATDGLRIFVAQDNGVITALSPATGATLWHQDALKGAIFSRPLFFENALWVGDTQGRITAISPESGKLLAQRALEGSIVSPFAPAGSGLAVQTQKGMVYVFDVSGIE